MNVLIDPKIDLDTLVADALKAGNFDCSIPSFCGSVQIPLLSAVCVTGRPDLARALLSAGATVTDAALAWVIQQNGDPATLAILLSHSDSNKECHLSEAVRHECWNIVFVLLEHGYDIQTKIPTDVANSYTTVLHVAAWKALAFVVKRLLANGAAVDARDSQGMTALMIACDFRDDRHRVTSAIAYWLLEYGADPNAVSPQLESPLLLCLGARLTNVKNRSSMAQVLLRYGANPNRATPKGKTPLMFAARDNDTSLVHALIRANADTTMRTVDGLSALDIAVKWNSKAVEAILRDT